MRGDSIRLASDISWGNNDSCTRFPGSPRLSLRMRGCLLLTPVDSEVGVSNSVNCLGSAESRRTFRLCSRQAFLRTKPNCSIARVLMFLAAWKSAWSKCPQLVQMNFSPSRLDLSTWPQALHCWLVCLGLTLMKTFPDFPAAYSILEIRSPHGERVTFAMSTNT